MMFLRLLNIQGIAGLAVGAALAILLVIQKGETRHWRKQSGSYEQLYTKEQAALAGTEANYRAAAEQARAADRTNAERVAAEQRAINERTINDYQARLADARARAERLRQDSVAGADPGSRPGAPVPGLPTSSAGPHEAPGQDGLPAEDALTATEQAIQLDELIEWVKGQAKVDNNGGGATSPPRD